MQATDRFSSTKLPEICRKDGRTKISARDVPFPAAEWTQSNHKENSVKADLGIAKLSSAMSP
jgi:hypothetical protein